MRTFIHAIVIVSLVASAPAAFADARQDLRVETDKDNKGNLVFELVNIGDKNIKATLQHTKTCSSTTSSQDPTERDYWLVPKGKQQLRKVIADSDCRHKYRIVKAEYF